MSFVMNQIFLVWLVAIKYITELAATVCKFQVGLVYTSSQQNDLIIF